MNNPKIKEWEHTLRKIFDIIDDHLEDKYGFLYPLHPARPQRGHTANKSSDGLFNIGAAFSAGFGSSHGRGWVVDVTMVTLSKVPENVKLQIYSKVIDELKRLLKEYYPERGIKVEKDGSIFKIYGDLGLEIFDKS
ncbi:MAG: hypothetical protein KAH95_11890 [Spirochaetales bacterium]|nr:hypothetical protein [Spirochaetales bacterium]